VEFGICDFFFLVSFGFRISSFGFLPDGGRHTQLVVFIAVATVTEDEVAGQQQRPQPATPAGETHRVSPDGSKVVSRSRGNHFFSVSSKKSII
jgi:hypothetical protein